MFAGFSRSRAQRRGIVLVVILGMLAILALIGVTFATFSGQAQVSARNFALSQVFPDSSEMMDYALSQLIDDTGNPLSALRGHSLKRDMYGNDAGFNGYLDRTVDPTNNNQIVPLFFTNATSNFNATTGQATLTLTTNIPVAATRRFTAMDFTRWVMKLRVPPTTQRGVGAGPQRDVRDRRGRQYGGLGGQPGSSRRPFRISALNRRSPPPRGRSRITRPQATW